MFLRRIPLRSLVQAKSVLLLGPRQTGKSSVLRATWPNAEIVDLLSAPIFRSLSSRPELLEDIARAAPVDEPVIVDEVQKVPELLDTVHRILEADPRRRFVLTGSSARKLRRAGTNLLGGRARRATLFPLIAPERASDPQRVVSLSEALLWGGLPRVWQVVDPRAELLDYVGVYLEEEIRAEALARSLGAFSRFLDAAAHANGEQIVFANLSRDAEVPAATVREYFQLLEDTLIGTLVEPFRGTARRKAVASSKFYFFDVGVAHALQGRTSLPPGSAEYGRALEHLVYIELRAALSYGLRDANVHYWRSTNQLEVDFVVTEGGAPRVAVEVKASAHITARDLRGLRALGEEFPEMRRYVVCQEPLRRVTEDGIFILPIDAFLKTLWGEGSL